MTLSRCGLRCRRVRIRRNSAARPGPPLVGPPHKGGTRFGTRRPTHPLPGAGYHATTDRWRQRAAGTSVTRIRTGQVGAHGHSPGTSRPCSSLRSQTRTPRQQDGWCSGAWAGAWSRHERAQSLIVFGPTQSHKTSGLAVPAILGWKGPVIAASVKTDLLEHTIGYRRTGGAVSCFDPSGSTGMDSASWSPLPASRTWPGARRAAAALTDVAKTSVGSMTDGDFWYATATEMLAPLLFAAAFGGGDMSDVIRWVDTHEEDEVLDLLDAAGVPEALARGPVHVREGRPPAKLDLYHGRDHSRAFRRRVPPPSPAGPTGPACRCPADRSG